MVKKILIAFISILLVSVMALTFTGCSPTDFGKQLSANWGVGDISETFTYDALLNNKDYGTFTLSVRRVFKTETTTVNTVADGAVTTKELQINENCSVITGKLSFYADSELDGDGIEYVSIVDKLLRPVYVFKTLSADKYNALHASDENYTPAVNYAYSVDYSYENSEFKNAKYAYLEQGKEVKTGEISSKANYYFDNDSLILVLRSLPIANMNSSFSYDVFNIKDGTSTALYSSFTTKQSLSDVPYYNGEAVSTVRGTVSLSQDIAGKSIQVFYSNEDITLTGLEYDDNGTIKTKDVLIKKAPVKIIESTMTYVLRSVTATPRP